MIYNKDLIEIRNRDFLKNINHFRDYDHIETKIVFGGHKKTFPFLSIIVPVYNHPIEFIKRSILSALNQECNYDFEMIVIDDYAQRKEASETELFLRELNDDRIIYYKNSMNLGVFANWNRGIELSRGAWILILHTDDFLKNNFLQNMKDIIDTHPEIDQLTCVYKMLNFLKGNFDIAKEFIGGEGKKYVRKVKYTEYLYYMATSVKGSMYKRDCLINLGGFRSQSDGIGLDDYPLMLRFAYYYNTYMIEDVLYLDSWGYNDSLNIKHWYPELVANYYMWIYFAEKENSLLKYFYKLRAKYLLKQRAIEYNDGTSWVGVPVPIDFEQLKKDCGIDFMTGNFLEDKLSYWITRIAQIIKNRPHKGFYYFIKKYNNPYVLD